MISTKSQFPHPVLINGRDDYSIGSFLIREGTHTENNEDFVFSFEYALDCPGLENYINIRKAEVVLFVSSSTAKFRNQYKFACGQNSIQVSIKKSDLVKSVDFVAYIISNGDEEFTLPEHNYTYYGGTSFSLRKGDLLAETATVSIDLDASELQKPLSSIFDMQKAPDNTTDRIKLIFDDEKINVILAPEIYEKYDLLKSRHPTLRRNLSAVTTLPALVEAIELMRSEGSDSYQTLRWYRALYHKLQKHEINLEETELTSTAIANIIYGDIILDALTAVKGLLDKIEENSEFQDMGGID